MWGEDGSDPRLFFLSCCKSTDGRLQLYVMEVTKAGDNEEAGPARYQPPRCRAAAQPLILFFRT
jgi:hypothetical protein